MNFFGISSVNLLIWLAFGIGVGLYSHSHDHKNVQGGIIATSVIASLGAIIGGYLASFLLGKAMITFSVEGGINASIGAIVLAIFYRSSFKNKGYIRMMK